MMAISAGGIGRMDVQTPKAAKSSKDDAKASETFASLINLSSVQNTDAGTDKQPVPTLNDGVEKTTVQTEYDSCKSESASKQEQLASGDVKEQTDSPVQNTQDTSKSNEAPEKEKIDGLLTDLKESLEEKLGITEEDIEDILASLGFELQDLIDPDAMKSFMMNVQGVTAVDLLIREDMANLLAELTDTVDGLLEKYGLTDEQVLYVAQPDAIEIPEAVNVAEQDIPVVSQVQNNHTEASADESVDMVIQVQENADITGEKIKTEPGGSNMQQSGQPGEPGSQIITNLNQAIENALQTEDTAGVSSYLDAVQEADIVRQVIDNIRVNITGDSTSLTLQLNPENLGKVQVSVVNKDGVMQAQIVAETEAARHAIENSISLLKEAFDNHELKVDAIEVMVASYEFFNENREGSFEEEQQGKNTGKNVALNLNGEVDEEILTEDEQLQITMMKAQGNSVSYSV